MIVINSLFSTPFFSRFVWAFKKRNPEVAFRIPFFNLPAGGPGYF